VQATQNRPVTTRTRLPLFDEGAMEVGELAGCNRPEDDRIEVTS
jgi:hypothetical protein